MDFKKTKQQMLVDQQSQNNAQAAVRNDEDATTTESVTGGYIGKVYLHKVIDTNVSI